jgi:hypothetical protein
VSDTEDEFYYDAAYTLPKEVLSGGEVETRFRDVEAHPLTPRESEVSGNLWKWRHRLYAKLAKRGVVTNADDDAIQHAGASAEGWANEVTPFGRNRNWALPRGSDGRTVTMEGAHVHGLCARLEKLVEIHPEVQGEVDREIRKWPVNTLLRTAQEEASRFRKMLHGLFDQERITFQEERQVIAAGDSALNHVIDKFKLTDLNGFGGWIAVEAATKAMRTKLQLLHPEFADELQRQRPRGR